MSCVNYTKLQKYIVVFTTPMTHIVNLSSFGSSYIPNGEDNSYKYYKVKKIEEKSYIVDWFLTKPSYDFNIIADNIPCETINVKEFDTKENAEKFITELKSDSSVARITLYNTTSESIR